MARNFLNFSLQDRHVLSNYRLSSVTALDLKGTNFYNTASFAYSGLDRPLFSTQQLNVDWSNFENHTFFSPATVNVNVAFDKIINGFPFDGTKGDVEEFFEKLTGFEKWVYDQFPKYRGSLHFSGTQVSEDTDGTLGTYISVVDSVGSLFPELSKDTSGKHVLGPKSTSWSIEMQLYVPSIATDGPQVILQKNKQDGNVGYTIGLDASTSTGYFTSSFSVYSGSRYISSSITGAKGQYEHVCYNFVNESGLQRIDTYLNETKHSTTTAQGNYIGTLRSSEIPLTIGSGSAYTCGGSTTTPTQTFSGSIDELRIFSNVRTIDDQKRYARKSIFQDENTVLYYKFNEPQPLLNLNGSSSLDSIVIDSSGNGLHSYISNFSSVLREDASSNSSNPMTYEKNSLSPNLFPGHNDVVNLNTRLLSSASLYDDENPNLITRLVPPHYFLEGQAYEGLDGEFGSITSAYTGSSFVGTGKLGSSQLFANLLYVYAKFFDDIKLYNDSFSTLNYVSYDEYDTCPDNFLLKALEMYGFEVPRIFSNSSLEQYFEAENTDTGYSTGTYTFKQIQTKILRRLLTNLGTIVRSKGTQHSIKAFMRSIGIDPEISMRIREYGGPTKRTLDHSRESRVEPIWMLTFDSTSLITSPYLSSSRYEVGFPEQNGTMVNVGDPNFHGISNQQNDGLYTSGSWTIETLVSFPITASHFVTESIIRLCTTGSNSSQGGVIANLLAVSSSVSLSQSLHFHLRTGTEADAPSLLLELSGASIFDGDKWAVSFGRIRNDDPNLKTYVSSSFFLRAGKHSNGTVDMNVSTSSFFAESYVGTCLQAISEGSNSLGPYIAIGQGQTLSIGSTSAYTFLNNTLYAPSEARVVNFSGRLAHTRFWSKYVTDEEWREHILNFKSTGVSDPFKNWGYNTTASGSFGRLRLDTVDTQDELSSSAAGTAAIIDYSGNDHHMSASGYRASTPIFKIDYLERNSISSLFDEFANDDKIRIRSFVDSNNIDDYSITQVAPVFETNPSEIPNDDRRLSIEFSLVDALNRDIVSIFSTLDSIDDAIGSANLMYSVDYPQLEKIRDVYFNRLTERLKFKEFFEFFKWFDVSLSVFVEQIIPKKTLFKGIKYMIESHMLERHKIVYPIDDQRLGVKRQNIRDKLFLQNIVGNIKRY